MQAAKFNSDLIYHQKFTLVENIIRYVREAGAKSLLDIGAGSPEIALPISRSVDTYLAVEKDSAAVARLRVANLEVIDDRFPLPVPFTFDMVLSSHSIPERSVDSYQPFLSAAWELTNPGGLLLFVTFKGNAGDLANIGDELLKSAPPAVSPEYEALVSYLENRGETRIERVNSYIEARSAEILASFLAPWLTGSKQVIAEIMPAFIHLMNTRYKVRQNHFIFPTEHLFISCKKPGSTAR